MKVKLLENYGAVKSGLVIDVPDRLAKELISKGIAMKANEHAIDRDAHDSLNDAKARDQFQGSDSR